MTREENPKEVVEYMLAQDYFSQWLGIKVLEVRPHYCFLEMPVRKEMINGLKTLHGGVSFSLADSALAFSSNNQGEASVALQCSINFSKAAREGDTLYAESIQVSDTRKTGLYDIKVTNQNKELVALFRGTVYKIGKKVKEL